ncbi:MAG TPA: CPBP family glutamic-type intramembrane protease, partial [Candidatus Methanoperedens sp.]
MRTKLYLPLLGIAAGEIMMFSGHVIIGLIIHIINLQAITLTLVLSDFPNENMIARDSGGLQLYVEDNQEAMDMLIKSFRIVDEKNLLQSLLLLLLMRIINLAMPQFFTLTLLWYPLIYGVMYISIYYVTHHQNISSKDIGINFTRWYFYIPLAFLIGAGMAMIEFRILHPVAMIANLNLVNILLISIVMFVFVAAVEELIFRSILQTRLQSVFGANIGILLAGALFGIMHAGYG